MRPNKIELKVNEAKVVSDGKRFRATIDDLPGQVLTKDAPAKLTLPMFFSDPLLANVLGKGPAGPPPQLMLLLADDPMKMFLGDGEEPTLAEPGKIDNRDCYRVKLKRPEGTIELWIDQQTFALQRVLPPTDPLRQQLEAEGQKVDKDGLSLVAEFTGAAQCGRRSQVVRLRLAQGCRGGEVFSAAAGKAAGQEDARTSSSLIWTASRSRPSRWPARSWCSISGPRRASLARRPSPAWKRSTRSIRTTTKWSFWR